MWKFAAIWVFGVFALAGLASGQSAGSKDLTVTTGPEVGTNQQHVPPKGCVKEDLGFRDGYKAPDPNQPRQIRVEVKNVSDAEPLMGQVVEVEIELRNTGKYPIQIPWSTDSETIRRNQDPEHYVWEVGRFEFVLKGSGLLVSQSLSLFGSEFSAGSMLAIEPGEWVTLLANVKLSLQYPISGRSIKEGGGKLVAEWHQTSRSMDLNGCGWMSGYYMYRGFYKEDFYKEEDVPAVVKLKREGVRLTCVGRHCRTESER